MTIWQSLKFDAHKAIVYPVLAGMILGFVGAIGVGICITIFDIGCVFHGIDPNKVRLMQEQFDKQPKDKNDFNPP